MSLDVLITGRLHGKPQSRTSQAGKQFATCTVRTPLRDGSTTFASVICFDESACQALLALDGGDAVSIAGEGALKVWQPKARGEARPSLDVLAHQVLSEYAVARKRRAAQDARNSRDNLPFHDDLPRGAA